MNKKERKNHPVAEQAAASTSESPGELMHALIHAAQNLQNRVEDAFEDVGLSWAKYGVLAKLAEAGNPLSLSDLASRLSCVRSNMTQLVDRLEADGLVRRAPDPSDRRVVRAELTPLGVDRAEAGARQLKAVEMEFGTSLSSSGRDALAGVLSQLR
jgi:DNA-binding MarR family transcriptional regulator